MDASSAAADQAEQNLLDRLTCHSVFQAISSLPEERFLSMLLQRRFISIIFPVVYDIGVDGLSDASVLKVVRQILREEYPDEDGDTPSHREDLVHDLVVLGATKAEVLACRPTPQTTSIVVDTLRLIGDVASEEGDVGVVTMLRFWGEVLVSVEYGEYWKRMAAQFDAHDTPSRFYYPHYSHDGREPLATSSAGTIDDPSATHSSRLGACLKRLLATSGTAAFAAVETQVMDTRLRFYDQF